MRKPIVSKTPVRKAVALAAGIGLAMLSSPVHAAPASGGDTVQGLYDALLSTMTNELAGLRTDRAIYPNLDAWVRRFQARPAYKAAIARGGPYSFAS